MSLLSEVTVAIKKIHEAEDDDERRDIALEITETIKTDRERSPNTRKNYFTNLRKAIQSEVKTPDVLQELMALCKMDALEMLRTNTQQKDNMMERRCNPIEIKRGKLDNFLEGMEIAADENDSHSPIAMTILVGIATGRRFGEILQSGVFEKVDEKNNEAIMFSGQLKTRTDAEKKYEIPLTYSTPDRVISMVTKLRDDLQIDEKTEVRKFDAKFNRYIKKMASCSFPLKDCAGKNALSFRLFRSIYAEMVFNEYSKATGSKKEEDKIKLIHQIFKHTSASNGDTAETDEYYLNVTITD